MAFDFESALLSDYRPDLGVVADYFLRLKTAAPTDPPDVTGMLEGQFAVPIPELLQHLAKMVKNEFDTIYAYTVYGQTLRGMARDDIVEHFQDHVDDELEHANFLLRRMAVLGGGANVPEIDPPHPSTDPCDIIKTMLRMEQESIADWRTLVAMSAGNPMRIKAEEYMVKEQEHADDLWQLLPAVASPELMAIKTSSKADREAGRASAERAAAARFERYRYTRSERSGDLVGRIAGAVLGGSTHALHKKAPVSVGAAAVGQHVGGKIGREIGRRIDAERFAKEGSVFSENTNWPSGDPADAIVNRWIGHGNFDRARSRTIEAELAWGSQGQRTKGSMAAKMAMALKRAFDEMAVSNPNVAMAGGDQQGVVSGTGMTVPAAVTSDDEPVVQSPQPQAPMPTQAPLTDPALSSFVDAERAGTIAELQQQAAYYKQMADQAQQTAESMGQQLQSVQQQAGELEQQVQQSQAQIQQSMQQAQQIQQQAMQTAQAAQQIAAQSQVAHLQAVNDAMLHRQLSENMRAAVAKMKADIQTVLTNDPTQGIEMQLGGQTAPTAGPEVQPGGPAANAPDQELPPDATSPNGDTAPQGAASSNGGPAMEGAAPSGGVKTSGARFDQIKETLKRELKERGPYMAVGGALGAGVTALGRPHSVKTKKDLEAAEAKGGTATSDLNVAKQKIRHAMAEYVDKHPIAGSALIGIAAANTAGAVGPTARKAIAGYLKHRKDKR
jgi:bacterioferritin (cytochrome b1)